MVTVSGIMVKASPVGTAIRVTVIGIIGTVLIEGFLCGLVSSSAVVRVLPWVVGFNGLLSGFSLVDRMGASLRRARIGSTLSGFAVSLLSWAVLLPSLAHLYGGPVLGLEDLALAVMTGSLGGFLGGLLALRYHRGKGTTR